MLKLLLLVLTALITMTAFVLSQDRLLSYFLNIPTLDLLIYYHDHLIMVFITALLSIRFSLISSVIAFLVDKHAVDSNTLAMIWSIAPIAILLFTSFPSHYLLLLLKDSFNLFVEPKVAHYDFSLPCSSEAIYVYFARTEGSDRGSSPSSGWDDSIFDSSSASTEPLRSSALSLKKAHQEVCRLLSLIQPNSLSGVIDELCRRAQLTGDTYTIFEATRTASLANSSDPVHQSYIADLCKRYVGPVVGPNPFLYSQTSFNLFDLIPNDTLSCPGPSCPAPSTEPLPSCSGGESLNNIPSIPSEGSAGSSLVVLKEDAQPVTRDFKRPLTPSPEPPVFIDSKKTKLN